MPLTSLPLAGHGGAAPSATVIPLRDHRRAVAVQNLTRAERHRAVCAALARGSLAAVVTLSEHIVQAGGTDYAGALGLHLAATGARDAAAELADAEQAVTVQAANLDAEVRHG